MGCDTFPEERFFADTSMGRSLSWQSTTLVILCLTNLHCIGGQRWYIVSVAPVHRSNDVVYRLKWLILYHSGYRSFLHLRCFFGFRSSGTRSKSYDSRRRFRPPFRKIVFFTRVAFRTAARRTNEARFCRGWPPTSSWEACTQEPESMI